MSIYSSTPLSVKLGITAGRRIALLGAPEGFTRLLGELPERVAVRHTLRGTTPFDMIMVFATERDELAVRLDQARRRMPGRGACWVAWPGNASKVPTDLTEDVVREVALPAGLVDDRACAVDETWSGLRLVVRRRPR